MCRQEDVTRIVATGTACECVRYIWLVLALVSSCPGQIQVGTW
jgi:hypothetical protein